MTQQEALLYWKESARDNAEAARDIAESHPEWSFFLWHLALEKLLKGLVTKRGTVPPPIHNLVRLVELARVTVSEEQKAHFKEINTYNVDARYEDYKHTFYKKVIQSFYQKQWLPICEELYVWLDKQF